jgi:hypothetical protein
MKKASAHPAMIFRYPMAEAFEQEITTLYETREQEHEARRLQSSLSPQRGTALSNLSLERFRSSTKYQDRPAAAAIAFCVAAFANGIRRFCPVSQRFGKTRTGCASLISHPYGTVYREFNQYRQKRRDLIRAWQLSPPRFQPGLGAFHHPKLRHCPEFSRVAYTSYGH